MTPEIEERLLFELKTIENTGYPGYFLIVQDFTSKAREMGVSVGPGRGSAAGSAVAFCTAITNVDPIAYDLLFERFLNPDRVSLPDIDIDFDDEGRDKVLKYVIDKYGKNRNTQATYGQRKYEGIFLLKTTAYQRTISSSFHDPVDMFIDHMVNRSTRGSCESNTQQTKDENIQRHKTIRSQQHPNHRRKYDQVNHFGFSQIIVLRPGGEG